LCRSTVFVPLPPRAVEEKTSGSLDCTIPRGGPRQRIIMSECPTREMVILRPFNSAIAVSARR